MLAGAAGLPRFETFVTISTAGALITLDQANKGGKHPNPRAADDFQAIRARMEELRRKREETDATGTERASVQPARRDASDRLAMSYNRRYRSIPEKPLANCELCLAEQDYAR